MSGVAKITGCETSATARLSRGVAALLGIGAWFATQSLLASRGFPEGIGDGLHALLDPLTGWLAQNDSAANLLLIITSAAIDGLGGYLLFSGVMGPTVRPLLGLFLLFGLRQLCQALVALPPPPNMIWRDPGLPSLLVTYETGNDFFFSGHTAIAVYGAMELSRLQRPWLKRAALLVVAMEIFTVLVLRAHYTMDVFSAVFVAWWVASVAARLAPACDRLLVRWLPVSLTPTEGRK
jgi:hypothetical protein